MLGTGIFLFGHGEAQQHELGVFSFLSYFVCTSPSGRTNQATRAHIYPSRIFAARVPRTLAAHDPSVYNCYLFLSTSWETAKMGC